jgi:hexosaminidase
MLSSIVAALLIVPSVVQGLWPIPRNLQTGTTFLKLGSGFDITTNIANAPQDLLDAIERTKGFLKNDKLQRLVVGRGSNDTEAISKAISLSSLTLSLANGQTARPVATESVQAIGTRSEGYSLNVPADGSAATLTANSTLGLFRGLTTFSQLWYDLSGTTYTYQAPVKISNDTPAFVSQFVRIANA